MARFVHDAKPKLIICSQILPIIVCPKCSHHTIWFWVFARLPHHDEPRSHLSRELKWRVRGAHPNCVRLLMVIYSIGDLHKLPQTNHNSTNINPHTGRHQNCHVLLSREFERLQSAFTEHHQHLPKTHIMTQRNCFPAPNTINKRPPVHITCRANNFTNIREGKQDAKQ